MMENVRGDEEKTGYVTYVPDIVLTGCVIPRAQLDAKHATFQNDIWDLSYLSRFETRRQWLRGLLAAIPLGPPQKVVSKVRIEEASLSEFCSLIVYSLPHLGGTQYNCKQKFTTLSLLITDSST